MFDKTAIITGATSGLGKAFATQLAKRNWNLFLTGRKQNLLETIKEELEGSYDTHIATFKADLCNQAELRSLISSIDKLSNVDMLINNAGFGNRSDFYEDSFDKQSQMLQVHITAASRIIHTVVPKMKKQKSGSIINVASLCAYLPAPLSYFYCSSKAFIANLSECMFIDLHPYGIKIQALCPGFINTSFHSRMGLNKNHSNLESKLLWMSDKEVVSYSLRHLKSNKVICIPGIVNKLIVMLSRVIPRPFYYKLTSYQAKKINSSSAQVC
ncbi:SDR family oxidoreductase [Carboxylicivirga sp. M1479]|uniref:SDR family NAD(P)-dependent oxidoreductase n=1 Tax=Carboxylicivirga sp. M1479 TaxID=2594476 RepID=UPI0011781483|nr:SDR family NAD(P)-dependent oxidoreductase [Carboxylicivirga sp. M1479]TRX72070.1 SDR family NAD(P)-dependent oxidoreductase [Carboxylicivirga sp. M1479]